MIEKSAIISQGMIKSGIGRYSWDLYQLGLFQDIWHFSYDGKSDFKNYVYFSKSWFLNTSVSYYIGGIYKKYVEKYNFVHVSSPGLYHLAKYNKNIVGTLHDLFVLKYPYPLFFKRFWFKNIKYIYNLEGVVTISDYIKKEAEERFKDIQFTRIHHWIDDKKFKKRDKYLVRKKLNLEEDKIYLLNVGSEELRKNLNLLPKIMNQLDDRFVLIRIGKSESILNKFKNKKNVIIFNSISDDIFPLYYNAADLLIHTSIDGGFEYPYIEAIYSNLNIITFDIPIAKEVLRDKAIFIPFRDKDDPEDWIDAILKNYDKKPDYGDLIDYYKPERARKDYENFYKKIGWL